MANGLENSGQGKKCHKSGNKKEPKPKAFGLDIFGCGEVLPHEGMGAKKLGMPLETQGKQTIGRDIPGFCWDIPGAPEKFEKIKVRVQFLFPNKTPPQKRFWVPPPSISMARSPPMCQDPVISLK